MIKFFICSLFFAVSFVSATSAAAQKTPRAIVVVVIDQMRADQILKWKDRFTTGGYRKLMREGSYLPFAEYPVLQNMTCPGHAMILTGSVPAQNKIPLNEWYDRGKHKNIYCAEDAEFGLSPARLQGSTLGDQMKLANPLAKVVTVSMKDRSAIMLGGHGADAAYWFDPETLKIGTGRYYKNAQAISENVVLPKKDEILLFEKKLGSRPFSHQSAFGSKESWGTPVLMKASLKAAEAAWLKHDIAKDSVTDLFAVSISSHDLAGHQFGPDSPEMEELTLQEDRMLADFFSFVDKNTPGGLAQNWIVLTADHGVAPLVEAAVGLGLSAGRISQTSLMKALNQDLREKFGACDKSEYILATKSFHFYFENSCLKNKTEEILQFCKERLLKGPGVEAAISRLDIEMAKAPAMLRNQLDVSYVPGISGDLILIPKPFWYEDEGPPANHMTHYSYDRMVPLIFWGTAFRKETLGVRASVIDVAPTLAWKLGIIPPAQSSGRVLTEILK